MSFLSKQIKILVPVMLIITHAIFSQPADLILLSEPYGGGMWTVHSDGSNLVEISDFGWYGEFSKAGEKIAFSKYYKSGIWTMNLDGSNKQQLTSSGSHPSWSPLGDRIVYATGTTYSYDGRIRIMNSDGTGDALLTTRVADRPNWAHFSDKIVFESYADGIWVINPDGTGETQINAASNAVFPSWTPDDSKILFSISGSGIYMMDPDGSNVVQLTTTYGLCPSMGSDGRVAYMGADDEVYILDTATHIETLFATGYEAPDWNTGINTPPYDLGVVFSGVGLIPFSSTGSPPKSSGNIPIIQQAQEPPKQSERQVFQQRGVPITSLLRPGETQLTIVSGRSDPPLLVEPPRGTSKVAWLTRRVDAVIIARVESRLSMLTPDEDWINTSVQIKILQVLKSTGRRSFYEGQEVSFVEQGGSLDVEGRQIDAIVRWASRFEVGKEYLIFADVNSDNELMVGTSAWEIMSGASLRWLLKTKAPDSVSESSLDSVLEDIQRNADVVN